MFNVTGKNNNQTLVSEADEKPNPRVNDYAGNRVNLVSDIFRLPLDWDVAVCIRDR